MHQRLHHKEIHYTAMRPFTSVKLNILQLQNLMNALKFTLLFYLEVGNSCWEVIKWILISAFLDRLSTVLLLIINLTNGLRLHRFLRTKTTEANKSQKTDANGAH